jgi:hypothetical protein
MVAGIRLSECGEPGASGGHFGRSLHLLHCGSGSERNDTHHSIRDTMFYIMREAGYSVRREQSGVMPIREGEAGGRVMDLVAADPRGGSRVLADVVVADSDTVHGGHGDGNGARARGTAGGGDEGWEVRRSQMIPSFRLQ